MRTIMIHKLFRAAVVMLLAVAALTLSGAEAQAQYIVRGGYNPYTGTYGTTAMVGNPWLGFASRNTVVRNPWTGTVGQTTIIRNPWTRTITGTTQFYNPYTNRFAYRWGVRRW